MHSWHLWILTFHDFFCTWHSTKNLKCKIMVRKAKLEMKKTNIKKLTVTAGFVAIAVIGSLFSVPVFGSKCAPIQHLVNILCAVLLGPWYSVSAAFLASLIRNMFGLGTLLAFPGSMCGAFLAGMLYRYGKKLCLAYLGEVLGTALLGGMLSFLVAVFFLGNKTAALFTFVVPFLISTLGGAILAVIIMVSMKRSGILERMKEQLQ